METVKGSFNEKFLLFVRKMKMKKTLNLTKINERSPNKISKDININSSSNYSMIIANKLKEKVSLIFFYNNLA